MNYGPRPRFQPHEPVDIRSISGFYPTPPLVIEMMMHWLGPIELDHRVLEPSAGRGDIADRLARVGGELVVVEPNPVLAGILREKGYLPVVRRFEEYEVDEKFDRIAMNPPFAEGLDMTHVRHAFGLLKPGGIVVTLMNDGNAPGDGTPQQRKAFNTWLGCRHEIAQVSVERLGPELFISSENFRPSYMPMKLVRLVRRHASAG